METILEVLKYTIPSFVVFFTAYFVLRERNNSIEFEKQHEKKLMAQKQTINIRLQAYERIVLLLERISPENLLTRVPSQGMTVMQYQSILSDSIRKEFDHNLSQQIYISDAGWAAAKDAKENVIRLINTVAGQIKHDAPATELSRKMLEILMQAETGPVSSSLKIINKEVAELF